MKTIHKKSLNQVNKQILKRNIMDKKPKIIKILKFNNKNPKNKNINNRMKKNRNN